MRNRIVNWFLICTLLMTLLPFGVLAAEEEPVVVYSGVCGGGADFTITSDGVMTITGTGKVEEPVVTWRNPDVELKAPYRKLVISEGITEIGSRAFLLKDLYEIIFPDSLERIDESAFEACWFLKTIRWGNGLKSIGERAFQTDGITELVLPSSVQSIGSYAFSSCDKLERAVLYGDLGSSAFSNCSKLESVTVVNAREVGSSAFHLCDALKSVVLADTITKIGDCVFSGCKSLNMLRLPAGISELEAGLFRDCTGLESIIIPAVSLVGAGCFENCGIRNIYYAGTEAQLQNMEYYVDGNDALKSVNYYLIPGMPDPVYGFFDMPNADNWAYEGIAFCLDNGLMNGMGDGFFQPEGTTTRAQLVTILWRMCEEPEAVKAVDFKDTQNHWAKNAIAWAAENSIVNGVGEGLFAPDAPITREQLVTIFHRFCMEYLKMDVSQTQALSVFPDAGSVSAWATDAMKWGVAVKLISGSATTNGIILHPQGNATRAQIAKVILNFMEHVSRDTEDKNS